MKKLYKRDFRLFTSDKDEEKEALHKFTTVPCVYSTDFV